MWWRREIYVSPFDFALKWVTGAHTMHYTLSHRWVINLPYPSCYSLLEPQVLFVAGGKRGNVPENTREDKETNLFYVTNTYQVLNK